VAVTLGPVDHQPSNVTAESRINDLTALRAGWRLAHASKLAPPRTCDLSLRTREQATQESNCGAMRM
jgi:hypothetical protein